MKTVYEAVSDYVADNSTTKDAVAESLEIGRSTFFMKVRGASEFTLPEAYRLSRMLGCSIDDLYEMTQAG